MADIPIKYINHIPEYFPIASTSIFALQLYNDILSLSAGTLPLSAFEAIGYVYVPDLSSGANIQDINYRRELNYIKSQIITSYNL